MLSLRALVMRALTAAGPPSASSRRTAFRSRGTSGPAGRWWEPVRRGASRSLGAVLDERAGPRPITEGEYAGTYLSDRDAFERLLWAEGFVRNPFSRLKVREDGPEVGSWVTRDSPLADRQLHLMLFPGEGRRGRLRPRGDIERQPATSARRTSTGRPAGRAGRRDGLRRFTLETRRPWVEPPTGAWDEPRRRVNRGLAVSPRRRRRPLSRRASPGRRGRRPRTYSSPGESRRTSRRGPARPRRSGRRR